MNEFWRFLREEKRWWLTPIVILLVVLGALVLLVTLDSGLAPFVYPDR